MLLTKPCPFVFEFHSVHPLCSLCTSRCCPPNATNFNGHGISHGVFHVTCLFFRGLLFSSDEHLLPNPCFACPGIADRSIAQHISPVHKREFELIVAEVNEGSQGSQAFGEVGMWDSDGNVSNAVGGAGAELHGTELLGERVRGFGSTERDNDEEEEQEDCEGSGRVHGKCSENRRD
ncbi:hypothetical protein FNV43_RR17960 [Rhamnella rubrinervis]|uniref:Uncharacterized protein n=1 Tax=Rhamnella rubrinervis TaxID=2594499 RepID=A0A8K0DY39_9ROSA|nr:hypothetical protein FNV43_RR17960 [Rhamnella rubrinervis]